MTINDREDVAAQLALEGRLDGWQVFGTRVPRWGRGRKVPPGSYWASHWDPREPLIVAPTLDELEIGVLQRQREMAAVRPSAERAALGRILPPRG